MKTSGSKGLQLYVPLNTPVTYDETKSFSQALAQILERAHPKAVVSNMAKDLRKGKVFIDWSQNDEYKTTVSSTPCGPGLSPPSPPRCTGRRWRPSRPAGAPEVRLTPQRPWSGWPATAICSHRC